MRDAKICKNRAMLEVDRRPRTITHANFPTDERALCHRARAGADPEALRSMSPTKPYVDPIMVGHWAIDLRLKKSGFKRLDRRDSSTHIGKRLAALSCFPGKAIVTFVDPGADFEFHRALPQISACWMNCTSRAGRNP